jgi:hypothetical protein
MNTSAIVSKSGAMLVKHTKYGIVEVTSVLGDKVYFIRRSLRSDGTIYYGETIELLSEFTSNVA